MNRDIPNRLITEEQAGASPPEAENADGNMEKQIGETRVITSERRQTEASGVEGAGDLTTNANDDSFQSVGWQCFRHLPYLTEEAKVNLRAYKYAGGDQGLMYIYFYNPLAKWLVEKIPEWIAPNLITLTGFLFSAIPFAAIFAVFGTHFYNEEPKIPSWVFFAEAVCYFLYRMLDELDGKQARRTGNSSPLGLIFDHGCDAFAVGLQCMILAKLTQMGAGGILFVHGSMAIFHFATLEEYYIGGLFLPVGNAISDGSLLYFITMAIPGIFGNEFFIAEVFAKDHFYDGSPRLTAMNLILAFVVTVQTITVLISINNILKHKRMVRAAAASDDDYKSLMPEIDGEELECGTLVKQIFAYVFLQGSVQCLAFIGSEPFISLDGKPGSVSSLFLLMLMQSFLMQHLTTEVMLCHLTKQKYVPTQNKLNVAMAAVSLIVTAIWIVCPTFYEENIRMQTVLSLMLGLTFLCQWHFLLNTVSELAFALQISVFKVKDKALNAAVARPVEQSSLKEALLER